MINQSNLLKTLTITVILILTFNQNNFGQKLEAQAYEWKSVQMVGGGFVTGFVFHPTAKGICYCRTDMGGAYRRNPKTLRWEPLLDWLSIKDVNLMGVESIALDPSDPDWVFLSCGTYTNPRAGNGAILRSSDRGKTFQRTDVPFKMGGNEDGRGNGERMSVDPNNSNILYLGTRQAGLWKSLDRAVTWNKVENFPDITENAPANMRDQDSIMRWRRMNQGSGVIFTLFDPKSGSAKKGSSTIYVGVSLMNHENLFRSIDGGKTWQPVPGQPQQYRPTHAVLVSDGNLFVTYGNSPGPSRMSDGGVWKLNTKTDEWTEITPDKPDPKTRAFGYAAVSVDSRHPDILIVSSFNRYGIEKGDEIFRSLDGGKSWNKVFAGGGTFDYSLAPYIQKTGVHWMFDIEIDPNNPDHALFTTGYGGHETFNLTDMDKGQPTIWHVMGTGIEETVALELLSPPKGAQVITAIGDYGGFVHWDLDKPAPEGSFDNPQFGNTNSVACASNNPEIIVRVGRATKRNENSIGYSTDGGKTWQPAASVPHPQSSLGRIAVSADGKTWIWAPEPVRGGFGAGRTAPQAIPVSFTTDNGASWTECKGLPANTRVIADGVNPAKFYAMNLFDGKLFISTNGGADFTEQALNLPDGLPARGGNRGDSRGGQDWIYATPNHEGGLWIAAFNGLYHSADAGQTFSKIDGLDEIHGFGFGKAAPGMDYPAMYLIGNVNGVRGIYRSDNVGKNWIRINNEQHQWGLLLHITGDPKKYGRVYVGTHGRGTVYGDIAK
ncbi:MAG TPA: galactose oxidase [Prolixibacteraceae bacterium]|nr:galactose oxidase [Prolixibacteraceae bacterium]